MILTVTANPAIDRMYFIDRFDADKVHRVDNYKIVAGGKGVNVTKVLHALDAEVRATGFLGGAAGEMIERSLKEIKVPTAFAKTTGETRTTVSIADEEGRTFQLVENGPSISREAQDHFAEAFESMLENVKVVVFSGSLASALPSTFYRTYITRAKHHNVTTILDTSKEALVEGLKAGPDLIKPNKSELEKLVGRDLKTVDDIVNAARETLSMGAKAAAVSLGKDGMVYVEDGAIRRVEVPQIRAVNPVGSGDSVTAGFAHAFSHGLFLDETLSFANACGVSNAQSESIGFIESEDVKGIQNAVRVYEH